MASLASEIDDLTLRPTPSTQESTRTPSVAELSSSKYEPLPEDFFRTIFYFSGMGTVIGSALSEGVHVDERQRSRAVDVDSIPAQLRQVNREEYPLVVSCRNQAHNVYNGLKNLHTLLDQVPTYTESDRPATYRPGSTGPGEVRPDDPIHGHKYFRQNRMLHATSDHRYNGN